MAALVYGTTPVSDPTLFGRAVLDQLSALEVAQFGNASALSNISFEVEVLTRLALLETAKFGSVTIEQDPTSFTTAVLARLAALGGSGGLLVNNALALGENMINPDYWTKIQTFVDLAISASDMQGSPSGVMPPVANRDANGYISSYPGSDTSINLTLAQPYAAIPYQLTWSRSLGTLTAPSMSGVTGADFSQVASGKITFTSVIGSFPELNYQNSGGYPTNWSCRPVTDPGTTIESNFSSIFPRIVASNSFTRLMKWSSVERNNSPKQPSGAGATISSITNGAGTTTTATVTTATAHGLSGQGNGTGQQASVTHTGATPSRFNQTNALIIVISPTQYQYQTYSGIGISSITFSGTTATLTTASAHGLSTGAIVSVIGADNPYNVKDVSITVTGATTFTYTMLSTPSANAVNLGNYAVAASGNATVVGSYTYGDNNFQFWNLKYPSAGSEPGTQLNEPIYTSANRNLNASDAQYQEGVKTETLVTLAGFLPNSPWINMPWNADSTFYTAVANLWATFAKNNPSKQVAVETSNEVWNSGYTVTHQCANEANFRGTLGDALPNVRLVATSNITLSGLSAIDGFTPIAGDRILCVGQTTTTQNGVYVAAAGAWSRAADTIASLSKWFVTTGLINAQTTWYVQTSGTITLGTTPLNIPQFTNVCRYAEKAMSVFSAFETAFAAQGVSSQLVRVLAWQNAASPTKWDEMLQFGAIQQHCDALSTAPYYGNSSTGADVPTVAASIASDIGSVTDSAQGHYQKALAYSKNFFMYEGGVNGFIADQTLKSNYIASTQCYNNELLWLQDLELKCPTIIGTILTGICHFAYEYPQPSGDSNQWGVLSAGNQDPTTSQKAKAHIDFLAGVRVLTDATGTLQPVATDAPIGTSLGFLSPSAHGVTWSLTVDDGGLFQINAATGEVTTKASLSGATLGTNSITAQQSLGSNAPKTTSFSFQITPPLIKDAFSGSSLDATKWNTGTGLMGKTGYSSTGATVTENGGTLQITAPSTSNRGIDIESVNAVDLTQNTSHFAKFVSGSDSPGDNSGGMVYGAIGGFILRFNQRGSSLAIDSMDGSAGGNFAQLGTMGSYSPTTHAWIRMRYDPNSGTGAGAPISSITFSGTTATVTTSAPHNLKTGNTVTVTGATPAAYNVTNAAVTVLSTTTFSYTMGSNPGSNASVVGSFTSTPIGVFYLDTAPSTAANPPAAGDWTQRIGPIARPYQLDPVNGHIGFYAADDFGVAATQTFSGFNSAHS